jgi:transcription elongation factor Elf1
MPRPERTPFACPICGADYKVVRVEAEVLEGKGNLLCVKCGGPLPAREGRLMFKYFLVGGSRNPLRPRTFF